MVGTYYASKKFLPQVIFMNESDLQKEILLKLGRPPVILYRNNVGIGWVGKSSGPISRECSVILHPGDVVVRNARPLHAGMGAGSADLVGYVSRIITEDMLGQRIAQFLAIEVKNPTPGKASVKNADIQNKWLSSVVKAGGKAGIAKSLDDASIIISGE